MLCYVSLELLRELSGERTVGAVLWVEPLFQHYLSHAGVLQKRRTT